MFRKIAFTLGLVAGLAATAASAQDRGTLTLRDITTPLVPTELLRGDREFGGNGPDLGTSIRLSIGRGGRAIFANIEFSARETGGDGSHTRLSRSIEVWRWQPSDGARFVQAIHHPNWSQTIRSPQTCGTCLTTEDGARLVSLNIDAPYAVRLVRMIGDTHGDDISTDNNAHGDTSLRGIYFRPVLVTFTDRLATR